jgi:hypothetical protein
MSEQVNSLGWRRDGDGWLLLAGRRKFGRVVPDQKYPGMWCVQWPDGRLSDLTNLMRAKDALSRFAESESRRQRSGAEEGFRRPLVRQIKKRGTGNSRPDCGAVK